MQLNIYHCFNYFRSARTSYGDDAVSYVQVKREGNLYTIKAKICPEHKVHAKLYGVSLVVDEQEETVKSVECHDCVTSQGGCKHTMALCGFIAEVKIHLAHP